MVKAKIRKYQYHSLSIPVYFIDEVKKHIEKKPQYKSVAIFAQEAMKEKIMREKNKKKWGFDTDLDYSKILKDKIVNISDIDEKLNQILAILKEK